MASLKHVSIVERREGGFEVSVAGHEMVVLEFTEVGPHFANHEEKFDLRHPVFFMSATGREHRLQMQNILTWRPLEEKQKREAKA